jgi:hypothetical protein
MNLWGKPKSSKHCSDAGKECPNFSASRKVWLADLWQTKHPAANHKMKTATHLPKLPTTLILLTSQLTFIFGFNLLQ